MIQFDYYNRELKINDVVNLDNKPRFQDRARVIGFTSKKVKVYDIINDKTLYIYPNHLTKIFE
tara:strand:+ start:340 stop:528 length:189 start_codon:yes stop_codon:yes gene_type:complete